VVAGAGPPVPGLLVRIDLYNVNEDFIRAGTDFAGSGPHSDQDVLALPVEMIDQLKAEAARRVLPYRTLIRMWLKERLDAQTRERGRQHAGQTPPASRVPHHGPL
jgi:predicted DNA binding CopG/RHH family protein